MGRKSIPRTCVVCGADFLAYPWQVKKGFGNCCSRRCAVLTRDFPRGEDNPNWRGREPKVCEHCGATFTVKRADHENTQRFCSMTCSGLAHRGENGGRWKGGYDRELRPNRHTAEYKEWRESVLARDNWTCQDCGDTSPGLAVHHVFSFDEFPDFRLEIWNGVVLCSSCHMKTHHREWSL
jgi:hypothetical protein